MFVVAYTRDYPDRKNAIIAEIDLCFVWVYCVFNVFFPSLFLSSTSSYSRDCVVLPSAAIFVCAVCDMPFFMCCVFSMCCHGVCRVCCVFVVMVMLVVCDFSIFHVPCARASCLIRAVSVVCVVRSVSVV